MQPFTIVLETWLKAMQPFTRALENSCSEKFCTSHRKIPFSEKFKDANYSEHFLMSTF